MSEVRHVFTIEEDVTTKNPNFYVVRKWEFDPAVRETLDLGEVGRASNLETARGLLPQHVAPLPLPEPVGVKFRETWI